MAKAKAQEKKTTLHTPRGEKLYKTEGLMDEASKPQADRKKVLKTRKGLATPRNYHMDAGEATNARAAFRSTGVFQAPGKGHGKYRCQIQALADLGPNEFHPFNAVKAQVKLIMKAFQTAKGVNAWDAFAKPAVATEQSKDINGKIVQNYKVLQRLTGQHPYGFKLAQLFSCIDIKNDDKGMPMFRLNTTFKSQDSVTPLDETKRVRKPKAEAAPAKPKAEKPKAEKPKAEKPKAAPKAKPKPKPKAKAKPAAKKTAAKPKAKAAKPKAAAKPKGKGKKDDKIDPKLNTVVEVVADAPAKTAAGS